MTTYDFPEPAEQPGGATIIIPSRNRIRLLDTLLGELADQARHARDAGHEVEVIVVSDGDRAAFDLVNHSYKDLAECVFIDHRGFRPALYRNLGAAHAHTDQLIFLDDDCAPEVGFLSSYLSHVRDGLVGFGRIDYVDPDTGDTIESDPRSGRFTERSLRPGDHPQHLWTGNFSITRRDFYRLGGFDPAFDRGDRGGEGAELGYRADAAGLDVRFIEGAAVNHIGARGDPDTSEKLSDGNREKDYFITQKSRLTDHNGHQWY